MLHKTEGIILRTTKYKETTLIVKTYTRLLGLQHYIVKGIRSEKSQHKATLFQPGNILHLEVYKRQNRELNYLKEFLLLHFFPSIRLDIVKSSIFLFILEILNKTLKEELGNETWYDFIKHTFVDLNNTTTPDLNFHLRFLIDWSGYLGFRPSENFRAPYTCFDIQEGIFVCADNISAHCIRPPHSVWLAALLRQQKPEGLCNNERARLLEILLTYYQLHLPEFGTVYAHRILHEVLRG